MQRVALIAVMVFFMASQPAHAETGPPPPPTIEQTLFLTGERLRHGRDGYTKDIRQALQAHERAAALGHTPSLVAAAEILYQEEQSGITPDYNMAFAYFRRAAEAGNGFAMLNLAAFYDAGLSDTGRPERDMAMQWIQRAEDARVGGREVLYQEVFYRTWLPREALDSQIANLYEWLVMSWELSLDYGPSTLGASRRNGMINLLTHRVQNDEALLSHRLTPHHDRLFLLLRHEAGRTEYIQSPSDPTAQQVYYLMGLFHLNGWGGATQDRQLATGYLNLAADHGHKAAQRELNRNR